MKRAVFSSILLALLVCIPFSPSYAQLSAAPPGHIIEDEGTRLRQQPYLNIKGAGASCVNDDVTRSTICTFSTSTIASGTSALGTSAIASGACATVVTTAATGTLTTDVITAGFNGDPTAVTGYAPLSTGMLTIIAYPSANNVNFKVCNNTSASITPGAITLNWRVVR